MKTIYKLFLATFILHQAATGQNVFWSENFNNGCTSNCNASGYTGTNGNWSVSLSGTNGNVANEFFVSCAENGQPAGSCGAGCGNNATLHVGSVPCALCLFCPNGDCGAAYNAGPTFLGENPTTNIRAESPLINTTNQFNITLSFNYIEQGQGATDDALVVYSTDGGATWLTLVNTPKTNNGLCAGQGYWTAYSITLPASCENITNLKIGFVWINNSDGTGTDPSFAVDDIALSVPANQPPVADFVVSDQSICENDCVTFNDLTAGPVTSWQWTFTGATPASSTVQNPANICYATSGTYNVMLVVTNAFGSDTLVQQSYINVTACVPPVAAFTASQTTICDSTCITFSDSSSGLPNSYFWIFSGATPAFSSLQTPPPICYNTPGFYDVILIVSNQYGADTLSQPFYITVNDCALPVAAFGSLTSFCDSSCIAFSDSSLGNPVSWQWYFPGATPSVSTQQNPSGICYNNPGVYDVILVVSNALGTDSLIKPNWINVQSCYSPLAAFSASDSVLCEKDCINFFDLSNNNPTQWWWYFQGATPDTSTLQNPTGICYNQHGNYAVTLIAANALGTDTITQTTFVTVHPDPAPPVISSFGNVLNSTPAMAYQWYMNNLPIAGANNQVYVGTQPGDYYVIITDSNGCQAASNLITLTNTGFWHHDSPGQLLVYPVPAANQLIVFLFTATHNVALTRITDQTGQQVLVEKCHISKNNITIDIGHLKAGFYFLTIADGEREYYTKFSKL